MLQPHACTQRFRFRILAGDPEAGALASNGQGPPSVTERLRDAAEYVRLNVLPRPGQPQPPPQIIGRPSDVERLLDEAGQRAQEVERGAAQAVEETAAVAAEEGELAEGAAGGAAYGLARGTGWVLSSGLSKDAAVQDVRSANNMNDATQPQHFTLRTGSSTAAPQAAVPPRSLGPGAVQQHATPLLLGPEPRDSAPVPAKLQFRAVAPEPASAEL